MRKVIFELDTLCSDSNCLYNSSLEMIGNLRRNGCDISVTGYDNLSDIPMALRHTIGDESFLSMPRLDGGEFYVYNSESEPNESMMSYNPRFINHLPLHTKGDTKQILKYLI